MESFIQPMIYENLPKILTVAYWVMILLIVKALGVFLQRHNQNLKPSKRLVTRWWSQCKSVATHRVESKKPDATEAENSGVEKNLKPS